MPEEFVQSALQIAHECGYDLKDNDIVIDSLRALNRERSVPVKLTMFTLEYFVYLFGAKTQLEGVE